VNNIQTFLFQLKINKYISLIESSLSNVGVWKQILERELGLTFPKEMKTNTNSQEFPGVRNAIMNSALKLTSKKITSFFFLH
jgi:hypothetical protein